MQSPNTHNTLSRRNWLRNATIATTGTLVIPSFLTGCTDHLNPEPGGLGSAAPLTQAELASAGANLDSMSIWYDHLYTAYNLPYITRVYTLLKGGEKPPTDWKDILVDICIDIAAAILEAAVAAIPGVAPAIAITAKEIEKWGLEKKASNGVDAAVSEFLGGVIEMHKTVINNLGNLAEPGPNADYMNLQQAFQNGKLDFNGKTYTPKDLADAQFPFVDPNRPNESRPVEYNALTDAAHLRFQKIFWSSMFIKAGELHTHDTYWTYYSYGPDPRKIIRQLYADHDDVVAAYFRGYYNDTFAGTWIREYSFRFDGERLSPDAVRELFKDDLKGNIIHPDALFFRDYVFKQFHSEKPDFGPYCDVTTDPSERPAYYYDCSDFEFTAGSSK